MLDTLAGIDLSRFLLAIGVVGLGLLGLIGVMWIIRNRPSSPFVKGGRSRQQRLAVVDAAAVDARRRILLVRRDNVEHLIMIGGPTDIVIESRIAAAGEALATAPLEAGTQNTLELPELALELPAPALQVTVQQPAAASQKQAASTIQPERMTPAEPKRAPVPAEPLPPAEPLAFQPPVQKPAEPVATIKAEPVRREPLRPVTVISPAVAVTSPAVSVLSPRPPVTEQPPAEPEPEIRNPYLEAETARPAPVRPDREPAMAGKEPSNSAAPLAYKWPAPLETAKPEAKPTPVFPDHRETAELREPVVAQSPLPTVMETSVFPSQVGAEAINPALAPEPTVSTLAPNQPVDLDSLMSSDFLDAARNRVLSPVTEARPAPAFEEPAISAAVEAPSEFAKILDEELKADIPDARFETPRIETPRLDASSQRSELNREVAPQPGTGNADPFVARREPAPTAPAGSSLLRPVIFSEPAASDRTAPAAMSAAEPAKKSIADILDAARSRVLTPEATQATTPDMSFDDMMLEPEVKKATASSPSAVQDDFILEFEKIWESQLDNHASGGEANRPGPLSAPAVEPEPLARPTVTPEGYNQNNRRDPFLSPLPDEKELTALEQELSLDDEMAKVLGEFSLTRKR